MVLTGGTSGRLGRDKAFVELHGSMLVQWVVEALRRAGADEILAVGGDLVGLGRLGIAAIPDDTPGEGPFAALVNGLRHVAGDRVVVVACDLPNLEPSILRLLVDGLREDEVVIPVTGGARQYHCIAVRREVLPRLETRLSAGVRSLRAGLDETQQATVEVLDPRVFRDVDTAGDLAAARRHR